MPLRSVILFLAVLCVAGVLTASAAQVEQTYPFAGVAMPELLLGVGTRVPAMGGAGAAESDDLSSLFWNPAGLDHTLHTEAEFSHLTWIEGVDQEFLACGLPLLGGRVAAGLNYVSLGEIDQTGIDGAGQLVLTGKTLALSMLGVNVGYGAAAPWGGTLGGALKFRSENLGESSLTGMAIDAGVQYPLAGTGITLGAVLENLGLPVSGYPLPMGLRAGAGYELTLAADHQLTLAADAEIPWPAAAQSLWHAGIEYGYADAWFVRLGYSLTDLAQQAGGGLTAGLGAAFNGWTLGYTFAPEGAFGVSHRFSVALDLDVMGAQSRSAAGPSARRTQPAAAPGRSQVPSIDRTVPSPPRYTARAATLSDDELAMRQILMERLTVKCELRRGTFGGAPQGMTFTVTRAPGPRIKSWTLTITDPAGAQVAFLSGPGQPATVPWDLRNQAGAAVGKLQGLNYHLSLTDVNAAVETAEGPLPVESTGVGGEGEELAVDKTFKGITFDLGRSEINDAAAKAITRIAQFIRQYPGAKILIEGYCDPIDESTDALVLAKNRVDAVSRYLTAYHRIPMTNILIRVRGDKDPVVTSGDPKERVRNRRVEITIKNTP